jgi:hypothetical protein
MLLASFERPTPITRLLTQLRGRDAGRLVALGCVQAEGDVLVHETTSTLQLSTSGAERDMAGAGRGACVLALPRGGALVCWRCRGEG